MTVHCPCFALETPFSHVGGPGSWVPAEGAYGVFSMRPTYVPSMFLGFISTAIVATVCTRVHDPVFMGVWHLRPLGRGHFLAVGAGLCRGCVSVCVCHPLPSASHSWFVLVFVVQEKGLVSTTAVGFHGDLNTKPTLSILQINYFA